MITAPEPASTPAAPEPALARLGRLMARRRRTVVVVWIGILALALVAGPKVAGDWSVDYGTPGSDSLAAQELLERSFDDVSGSTLLFTWRSEGKGRTARDPAAMARANAVLRELAAVPGIDKRVASDATFSPDKRTAILTVPLSERPSDIADADRETLRTIMDGASRSSVRVRMGGTLIQEVQAQEISSEGVGLAVALIILLATFGTVVAAGLPIATALFGIGTGSAFVGLIAAIFDTPAWTSSVAAMVGIGVGIDYALLVLTRHRTSLRDGAEVEDSIAHALGTAGHSVLVAGGTVVISLLGLLLMGLPYLKGVGFATSATVLVVLIASLTLLPALLGFAGHRIDALKIPGIARPDTPAPWTPETGDPTPADQSPRFARWTAKVQRNAWTATLASLATIAVLTAPVVGVRLGFPGMGNDPVGSQTREAHDQMAEAFGVGVVGPLRVVVPLTREGDRERMVRLRTKIARDDRVAGVARSITADDGTVARLDVQSVTEPESADSAALLKKLREELIPKSGLSGVVIGGYTAETQDMAVATEIRLPLLFLGVAGLSALLLLVAFRSIVVPIKAGLMNLFSIAAAYGVVAFMAEGGVAGGLIGIDGDVPIPPFVAVLMFAVLFGLSMDYEVFLVGRIREYWAQHGDADRAIVEGVASTARVVTAAAAIMIAVFGAFTLSDLIVLKLIGVGMAAAILVDATIIRLVLVPALMTLMGSRNWWLPGWLDRLIPDVTADGIASGPPSAATPGRTKTTRRSPASAPPRRAMRASRFRRPDPMERITGRPERSERPERPAAAPKRAQSHIAPSLSQPVSLRSPVAPPPLLSEREPGWAARPQPPTQTPLEGAFDELEFDYDPGLDPGPAESDEAPRLSW